MIYETIKLMSRKQCTRYSLRMTHDCLLSQHNVYDKTGHFIQLTLHDG